MGDPRHCFSPRRPSRVTRGVLAGALFLVANVVPAAEFRGGEQVVVAVGEVVEGDLYATADTVLIEGTVLGDLVASGREVRVRGEVTGDLLAAGQVVVIEGHVGDDARIAGLGLFIKKGATVEGDVFAAGFAFESSRNSRIGGGAYLRSQVAHLGGSVDGEVVGGGGNFEIDGAVRGTVRLEMASGADPSPWLAMIPTPEPLPSAPAGLTLGPGARLGGDLVYTSSQEASLDPDAVVSGRIEREAPVAVEDEEAGPPIWVTVLRGLSSLAVVGLLLAGLLPGRLEPWTGELDRQPGTVLLLGLVALPVLLAGSLLLFVISLLFAIAAGSAGLGALAFALAVGGLLCLLLGFFLSWLGAFLVGPVVAAAWLGGRLLAAGGRAPRPWLGVLIGICLLVPLGQVPWLGVTTRVVAAVAGLGAIVAGRRGSVGGTTGD